MYIQYFELKLDSRIGTLYCGYQAVKLVCELHCLTNYSEIPKTTKLTLK